jgi:hypothetical protein
MPGLVFALGGRSPGVTWYVTGYPGSREVLERALSLVPPERLRRAYLLQTTASTEWLTSLDRFGINFPDDYVEHATFTVPYSWAREEGKWWGPRNR